MNKISDISVRLSKDGGVGFINLHFDNLPEAITGFEGEILIDTLKGWGSYSVFLSFRYDNGSIRYAGSFSEIALGDMKSRLRSWILLILKANGISFPPHIIGFGQAHVLRSGRDTIIYLGRKKRDSIFVAHKSSGPIKDRLLRLLSSSWSLKFYGSRSEAHYYQGSPDEIEKSLWNSILTDENEMFISKADAMNGLAAFYSLHRERTKTVDANQVQFLTNLLLPCQTSELQAKAEALVKMLPYQKERFSAIRKSVSDWLERLSDLENSIAPKEEREYSSSIVLIDKKDVIGVSEEIHLD